MDILSSSQLTETFGKFAYTNQSGGRVALDPAWGQEHLRKVFCPPLKGIPTYGGEFSGDLTLHRLIAPQFLALMQKIEQQGLLEMVKTYDGAWVPRHIGWNAAQPLSRHTWGIAIDLNARWNGYGVKPPPLGAAGSVRALAPLFEEFGFAWGGTWQKPDGMHFEAARVVEVEVAPPPTGVAPAGEPRLIVETPSGGWQKIPGLRHEGKVWGPVRELVSALSGEDTVHAEHLSERNAIYIKQVVKPH